MTGQHEHARSRHRIPAWLRATGIAVLLTAFVGAIFIAFSWPAVRSSPHDVPIGVTGPGAQANALTRQLDHAMPGGFAVTNYPSQDALETAIKARSVYGGFVLTPPEPTVVVATGGGPVVAQTLTTIAQQISKQTGMAMSVRDVAPLPAGDPRGAGLASAALPITLGGILPAALLTLAFPGRSRVKAGTAVAFSCLAAFTMAYVMQNWLGVLSNSFWPVAVALAFGIAAMSLSITGLAALLGYPGLGLGALLAIVVGNPLSGMTSAPEFLPRGYGLAGQLLPPGATGTLLRSAAYFDGRGSAGAILVLCCWIGLGAALLALDAVRRRHTPPTGVTGPTLSLAVHGSPEGEALRAGGA